MKQVKLVKLGAVVLCSTLLLPTAVNAESIFDSWFKPHHATNKIKFQLNKIKKEMQSLKQTKLLKVKVDCEDTQQALKNALEKQAYAAENVRFIISGECQGPLLVGRSGIEIVNNRDSSGSIVVSDSNATEGILVRNGSLKIKDLTINVPADIQAVSATANSVLELNNVQTNAHSSEGAAAFSHYQARANSSLYATSMEKVTFAINGSSYAEFLAGNSGLMLNIADTSTALSDAANSFNAVQVAGNGYFMADKQTQVELLMIWSKGAATAVDNSVIGEVQMGGQTMFAAYAGSTVNGPYGIWGNVIFEIDHSTANNWTSVDKPHSIISGNNATINGTTYEGWGWSGQDGTVTAE
ncbi:MAG: hypothetical protein GY951_11720 [Psychromonas sp.]|nr:hypothetical protein [Psychromonas sp.]